MGRLYAFTFQSDDTDEPPASARRFRPNEMMQRVMIAAVQGKPQVQCAWCKNRVGLEYARLQPGGWLQPDYYLCSACAKYGSPVGRTPYQRDGERVESHQTCSRCGEYGMHVTYFMDLHDGCVLCQDCMDRTGGQHQRKEVQKRVPPDWYVVKALEPEGECDLCHTVGRVTPHWLVTPWLLKTDKHHVCQECNRLAAEV